MTAKFAPARKEQPGQDGDGGSLRLHAEERVQMAIQQAFSLCVSTFNLKHHDEFSTELFGNLDQRNR